MIPYGNEQLLRRSSSLEKAYGTAGILGTMNTMSNAAPKSERARARFRAALLSVVFASAGLRGVFASAQSSSGLQQNAAVIEGTVQSAAGDAAGDAKVVLQGGNPPSTFETKTDPQGRFRFLNLAAGVYTLSAERSQLGKGIVESVSISDGEKKSIRLILSAEGTSGANSESSPSLSAKDSMQFTDELSFTVAGVTDPNNFGLHAAATNVRSSEALAKDTRALESGGASGSTPSMADELAPADKGRETENKLKAALAAAPTSFEANHQLGQFYCESKSYKKAIPLLETAFQINSVNLANSYELAIAYAGSGEVERAREQGRKMVSNANSWKVHRLVGDLDERLGDPLGAVREYQEATRLDASEDNYFVWGTELLVHKATEPAAEVFKEGFSAHPDSARMLVGLGAALYGLGSYEEAARRLCEASDLSPSDPTAYIFLGRMEQATPGVSPCSEGQLARFVAQQPGNALANYYYGLILWKKEEGTSNSAALRQAKTYLEKAIELDPELDKAVLQLGVVQAEEGDFARAMASYQRAIEINPRLGEAHYRLALAYRRSGEESKARQEIEKYKEIEREDADRFERQQRELQQFTIILKSQQASSTPH